MRQSGLSAHRVWIWWTRQSKARKGLKIRGAGGRHLEICIFPVMEEKKGLQTKEDLKERKWRSPPAHSSPSVWFGGETCC